MHASWGANNHVRPNDRVAYKSRHTMYPPLVLSKVGLPSKENRTLTERNVHTDCCKNPSVSFSISEVPARYSLGTPYMILLYSSIHSLPLSIIFLFCLLRMKPETHSRGTEAAVDK